MSERVFVTGIGILSGIGTDWHTFSTALEEGRDGIREVSAFDAGKLRARLSCEVRNFIPGRHFDQRLLRRMDRCSQFAVVAARDADALAQARRALPHYGQQGWVTISGGRTTARGQWPAATAWQRVCPH